MYRDLHTFIHDAYVELTGRVSRWEMSDHDALAWMSLLYTQRIRLRVPLQHEGTSIDVLGELSLRDAAYIVADVKCKGSEDPKVRGDFYHLFVEKLPGGELSTTPLGLVIRSRFDAIKQTLQADPAVAALETE